MVVGGGPVEFWVTSVPGVAESARRVVRVSERSVEKGVINAGMWV